MKPPKYNDSNEAIALRIAALKFADNARKPICDDYDTTGQKLNRDLLDAAIAYAMKAGVLSGR